MARVDSFRSRAGQIFCSCDSTGLPLDLDRLPQGGGIAAMASAFGTSVFSQVLVLSALPITGASMAPAPQFASLPYLALLLGAALAGFPASILMDVFGRKAAFGLGASLGLAGGILAFFAIATRQFPLLLIATLWLGMAQGFALFYRHAGAMAGQAGGFVFGIGALGALLGPFVADGFDHVFGPLANAFVLMAAGLANLVTLGFAVGLPARQIQIEAANALHLRPRLGVFVIATAIAAAAWFVMTGLMARTPLLMTGCGLGFGMVASAMALHVSAMYVPGFVIGRWIAISGGLFVAVSGLGLNFLGALLVYRQQNSFGFSLALALAGFGWGTATLGAMALLHRDGNPPSHWLGVHDTILFVAALSGALAFSLWG
jgi:MFS family permease